MRILPFIFVTTWVSGLTADEIDTLVLPLVNKHCVKCHSGAKPKADINLKSGVGEKDLLQRPELVQKIIEAVDNEVMPPEDEPQIERDARVRFLKTLRTFLRKSTANSRKTQNPVRRLNRFQYNNAVRDLFQLNRNVFPLPEKLMTRHGNYLIASNGKMPDAVDASSQALQPEAGLKDVKAFPKDLRAAHGFDNQANQLTLSPLLLDAFLRLSVSIVESPDFNEQNVGIWNDFFVAPTDGAQTDAEIQRRLTRFLRLAFRRPVDESVLSRYTRYVSGKLEQGVPFTDCMKKVASAALSSPLFLYDSVTEDSADDQFELASRLSFFLWSSGPDDTLLKLAENGTLSASDVLKTTIDRMMSDPKIERFLDSFPAQWMQLENVLAATPDPGKNRYFSLDKSNPAGLHMLVEPLLLFDAAFIENLPISEFVSPKFVYRSDFLKTWYTADLKPPKIDRQQIDAENVKKDERRKQLTVAITDAERRISELEGPVREKLMEAKSKDSKIEPVDLKPYAAWEFDGNLKSSVGSLDLEAHGDVHFEDGLVVLKRTYLQSKKLPVDLKEKSLEVWCKVHNLNQRGGGVMGIQGPGDFFDTIVLGERKPKHWISGSNGFSRTEDFPDSTPEEKPFQMLHLVMTYAEDGTTTLYRNGVPYGKPFRKGAATFPKDQTSVLFGLRHLPAGGNKYLDVSIDRARLYNRTLTAQEVSASASGSHLFVTEKEVLAAMTADQQTSLMKSRKQRDDSRAALEAVPPNQNPQQLQDEANRRYDDEIRNKMRSRRFNRVAADDPRYGGVITNAAVLSMTSGPKRTHPIARGAWIIEVIFNDPPPPPPNDVPPLNEEQTDARLTIREKFAMHRENPDCASCHSRLDPLGFALENFDITGRWRDKYENGRNVDSSGRLLKKYDFAGIAEFKKSIVSEDKRLARAFASHLLRFAVARELTPADSLEIDDIVSHTQADGYRLRSLIRQVALSKSFHPVP